MALSFVGATGGTASAGLPSGWQAGDLAIVFAYRDGSTTAPSLPTGWTNIINGGANTNSQRVGYRILQSGDTGTGTWTNATTVICVVYRGQDATPIGASAQNGGSSTTVTYPALTLQRTDGSSWVLCAAGHRSIDTSLETPPSGTTLRRNELDSTDEAAAFDTNGGVSSWSSRSVSVGGTSSGWRAVSVEIRQAPTFGSAVLVAGAVLTGTPVAVRHAAAVMHAEAIQGALARVLAGGRAVLEAEGLLAAAARMVAGAQAALEAAAALTGSARILAGGRGELQAEAILSAHGYADAGPTPVRLLHLGMRPY
jgi:hypothetical protein